MINKTNKKPFEFFQIAVCFLFLCAPFGRAENFDDSSDPPPIWSLKPDIWSLKIDSLEIHADSYTNYIGQVLEKVPFVKMPQPLIVTASAIGYIEKKYKVDVDIDLIVHHDIELEPIVMVQGDSAGDGEEVEKLRSSEDEREK